ncbi:MAG: response regulator [Vicinamibacterales bacterium]
MTVTDAGREETDTAGHRCTVLIVENEAELMGVLRVALETDGFDVAEASNGREALLRLRTTAMTCLIILDLHLPVMDGRRFRALQLSDRSLAWIPVVVVSSGLEAASEARELGARAFLRKPIDVDELREIVRRIRGPQARTRPDQRGLGGARL